MNFNNRTAHWVRAMDLYASISADEDLAAPVQRPDLDRVIALATFHAVCAGVGVDMMGQLATRERLSTPEEQATIAQREARKRRRG